MPAGSLWLTSQLSTISRPCSRLIWPVMSSSLSPRVAALSLMFVGRRWKFLGRGGGAELWRIMVLLPLLSRLGGFAGDLPGALKKPSPVGDAAEADWGRYSLDGGYSFEGGGPRPERRRIKLPGLTSPLVSERVLWRRLAGRGDPSLSVSGSDSGGVGGGVEPGWYSRIEHQFLRGRRCLLFLGLPSTS